MVEANAEHISAVMGNICSSGSCFSVCVKMDPSGEEGNQEMETNMPQHGASIGKYCPINVTRSISLLLCYVMLLLLSAASYPLYEQSEPSILVTSINILWCALLGYTIS